MVCEIGQRFNLFLSGNQFSVFAAIRNFYLRGISRPLPPMKEKGILYMLVSVVCFAVINVLVKSLHPMPAHELIFFRSFVSLSICLVLIRKKKIPFLGHNRKWLVIRAVCGLSALTLFFYTLQNIPLASATSIQYLSPIFTVLLAIVINKQQVQARQWLFFVLAFAGVVLIKWGDHRVSLFYLMLGVLSALLSGMAYNAIIKCRHTDHPLTVVMYFPLLAVPVMGVWSLFSWVMPQGIQWLFLLLIGLLTQVAQVSMTRALNMEQASRVTPFKYVGSVFALVFGYFIFDESLKWWSIVGIALVVVGVTLNTLLSGRIRKAA